MKRILIILFLPIMILATSCEKFVEGFEISPNSPTEVTPALQLANAQVSAFSNFTGQLARVASVLVQQNAGTDFQLVDVATYNILEGDNVNEWESLYADYLIDLNNLIANEAINPHYAGIAQIMKAMGLGLITDIWGDIPNSEALLGPDNLNPVFDSQESVYMNMQALLAAGINNLGKDGAANISLPSSDDFIHGGDVSAWIITANILQARYSIHLSKRNGTSAAQAALGFLDDAVTNGMTGPENDANAKFGTAGNELNSWNAFINSRGGYIKAGANLVDIMLAMDDPRRYEYFTRGSDSTFSGTPLESIDQNTSDVGPYFASPSSSAPLVSYVEAKFIEAEAKMIDGDAAGAATAHNDAIISHITLVTGAAPDAAYITAQASETATTIDMTKIMTHKYVAMYTQFESWTDWRRTGIPALTPDARGKVSEIPRRFPTPLSERVTNTNATVVSDILQPVWWDE